MSLPVKEGAPTKGRRYLTEGRVCVTEARRGHITARVRGDGTFYDCGYSNGGWWCLCPAMSTACAHLIAVRLVTAPDL